MDGNLIGFEEEIISSEGHSLGGVLGYVLRTWKKCGAIIENLPGCFDGFLVDLDAGGEVLEQNTVMDSTLKHPAQLELVTIKYR